jgi:hypothetical protein
MHGAGNMARSLNLFQTQIAWKKVTAATLVLAVLACLFPDTADAQRRPRRLFRYSGSSNNDPAVDLGTFGIDTTVEDSDPSNTSGLFRDAIQDFNISIRETDGGAVTRRLTFESADLTTSLLDQSDLAELEAEFESNLFGDRPPENLGISDLIKDPQTQDELDPIAALFANGGVKYEVEFTQPPTRVFTEFAEPEMRQEESPSAFANSVKFTFFTPLFSPQPSDRFNSINSLSNLESIPQLQGAASGPGPVSGRTVIQPYGLNTGIPSAITLKSVDVVDEEPPEAEAIPEPGTTLGLLGIGAVAAATFHKRRQQAEKVGFASSPSRHHSLIEKDT